MTLALILAVSPGCWDCVGLTNTEILAYEDDYDNHVGQIPYNEGVSWELGPPGVIES